MYSPRTYRYRLASTYLLSWNEISHEIRYSQYVTSCEIFTFYTKLVHFLQYDFEVRQQYGVDSVTLCLCKSETVEYNWLIDCHHLHPYDGPWLSMVIHFNCLSGIYILYGSDGTNVSMTSQSSLAPTEHVCLLLVQLCSFLSPINWNNGSWSFSVNWPAALKF